MDRREFLKGTAAAVAAAVLPLSILPESKKDPGTSHPANPIFTYTTEADMRWLRRVQFAQDNGIHRIWFQHSRHGYGTGMADNYTPHADFYTASIIVSFVGGNPGYIGKPLGHYKYQIWEDPTVPNLGTSGRRFFGPGEPYVEWTEDPYITMEEAEDHFWIAEFLALGYFKARGNKSQEHYDQCIKDLRECTYEGKNPLVLNSGLKEYPITREDHVFQEFMRHGPDEILVGESVY